MKFSIPLLSAAFAPVLLTWSATANSATVRQADEPVEHAEFIRLRPGELPSVALTGDILYRILASEIAATQGEFDLAGQTMLDLARETSDPRLAKRAFQFSMSGRDMARALRAAREWAVLAPRDPEAIASSLALAASNGQTAGLASALSARIEKAENKEQAIAQASIIIGKMADKRLALEVLETAIPEAQRNLPIVHLALADAAWAADDPTRAMQEAEKALALQPDSEIAAQRVLEYGLKVDPDEALDQTRAYLEKNPGDRRLQLLLIRRLSDRREYSEALSQLKTMRMRSPEDFDLLYTEAEVNLHAQRYEEAKALLGEYINVQTQRRRSVSDKATNAAADASDARLMLVRIAEKQERYDEAIKQLDLIEDASLRFQAQVHKAVLLGRQGKLAQATATIKALKPQDNHERSVAALTLASILRESGRTDDAVAVLVKADQDIPDSAEVKYDLAMIYERQGKVELFEKLLRRVIELDPNNANAYNSLGYTYADQNRNLDEAEELLERALELEPDNPFILDSIGWYLYRTGDFQAAIEYLERSYRELPAPDVAAHLGEVFWVIGRKDEARRFWKQGYDKDPQNETLVQTLKRFGVKF